MAKKTIFVILTIIISLLIILLGAEIMSRILVRNYVIDEMNLTFRYDKRLGWFPIESSSLVLDASKTFYIQHNKNGFRDIAHGHKTKRRIAFVGDSFVWGFDVDYGERFTEYLQKGLSDWGVINLGVSGYSTDQEFLLLQDWFDYYQPDIVVLVVCDNDRPWNTRSKLGPYYKPYFIVQNDELVLQGTPIRKSIPYVAKQYPLLFKSRFVQVIFNLCSQKIIQVEDVTDKIFSEMQSFVNSKGAEFFIAFTDDFGSAEKCSYCESKNIPYLLLTTNHRYETWGQHWTPTGHRIVSEKIHKYLIDNNLLTD